jgi:hypothetical protein
MSESLSYATLKTGVRVADPLNVVQATSQPNGSLVSLSAGMINDSPSTCPKCRQPMISASISSSDIKSGVSTSSSDERVYFCSTCRVTHPLKD